MNVSYADPGSNLFVSIAGRARIVLFDMARAAVSGNHGAMGDNAKVDL